MAATTLADIHPDVIRTHILPRLDGPSLSTTAMVSSHLRSLCSDHTLWAHICKSTWPSITHLHIDNVISTFPATHRSFFQDSFPSLIIDVNNRNHPDRSRSNPQQSDCLSCDLSNPSDHPAWPSEIISAVDIRYKNDIIYSSVEFTETAADHFLSSELKIQLSNDPNSSIDLKVDELACTGDEATLSHLKESLTLNWILIDPTRKRAVNLSSIKSVSARQDSITKETVVQYVTILPGCDPNEMVQCKIQVVLGFGVGLVGFDHVVKKVILKLEDSDSSCLNGKDFLVVTQGAIMEENNVRRKAVEDDEERWKSYKKFKEIKKEKKESIKKEERKQEFAIKMNYIAIFVTLFFNVYFLSLLLH